MVLAASASKKSFFLSLSPFLFQSSFEEALTLIHYSLSLSLALFLTLSQSEVDFEETVICCWFKLQHNKRMKKYSLEKNESENILIASLIDFSTTAAKNLCNKCFKS
jgi:hypothetical protein